MFTSADFHSCTILATLCTKSATSPDCRNDLVFVFLDDGKLLNLGVRVGGMLRVRMDEARNKSPEFNGFVRLSRFL